MDLGSDVVIVPETPDPKAPPVDPTISEEVFNVYEPYVGGASGYCQSSFQPCGGDLTGTVWVVEDSCMSLRLDRGALQREGSQLLGLEAESCLSSVRRLTLRWSGQLMFEVAQAWDERWQARRFDLELRDECFEETFGVEPGMAAAEEACASLNVKNVTDCLPTPEGCSCSTLSMNPGGSSGVYGVRGNRVSIWPEESTDRDTYDYCVQGNRLLLGRPGTNAHIVMRRRDATEVTAPEGPDDPR